MRTELFRDEVIHAQRAQWIGSDQLLPPRFSWIACITAVLCVGSIAALLAFGSYVRHAQTYGSVVQVVVGQVGSTAHARVWVAPDVARFVHDDEPVNVRFKDSAFRTVRQTGIVKSVGSIDKPDQFRPGAEAQAHDTPVEVDLEFPAGRPVSVRVGDILMADFALGRAHLISWPTDAPNDADGSVRARR